MSINFLLPNDTDPGIWRGPVIAGAVKQFWTDVIWENEELYYTTVKPLIGETFGASGQSSLVAAVLMMQNEEVLGTGLPSEYFNATKARVKVPGKTLEHVPLKNIMVNSIHAGGNTTSIILSHYHKN